MTITLLDGLVLIILLISGLLALFRGLSRELLSIFSWGVALWIADSSCKYLIKFTAHYIHNRTIAVVATFVVIFIISLVILTIVTMRLAQMVMDSRIGPIDRILGGIYGLFRGWVIAALAFAFLTALISPALQPSWLKDAKLNSALNSTSNWILNLVPHNSDNIFAYLNEHIAKLGEAADSSFSPPE